MSLVLFKKPNGENISINPDFIMLIEGVNPEDKDSGSAATKESLSKIFVSNNYSSFTITVIGRVEVLTSQVKEHDNE